jgi:hypothetical protein
MGMLPSQVFRTFLSMSLSGLMTSGLYWLDMSHQDQEVTKWALNASRQISAQVETLVLYAKERQEPDPIGWATRFLSVGSEDRPILISVLPAGTSQNEGEKFKFHSKSGVFNYSKIVSNETGDGIKIRTDFGYIGFLGTKSPWMNDLLIFVCFLLVCSFLLHFSKTPSLREELSESDLLGSTLHSDSLEFTGPMLKTSGPENQSKESIINWISVAKSQLLQTGIHIKNLIAEARTLAVSASRSKNSVEALLEKSKKLKECSEGLEHSLGMSDALALLKELIEENRVGNQEAIQSFEDTFRATQNMNEHISKTTEAMLSNAKLIQKLREELK